MTYLFAEDFVADAGTLRTAQRWIAAWRKLGFPRCTQVQRVDAAGRAVGGVQWAVLAADYDDLCNGRLREAA